MEDKYYGVQEVSVCQPNQARHSWLSDSNPDLSGAQSTDDSFSMWMEAENVPGACLCAVQAYKSLRRMCVQLPPYLSKGEDHAARLLLKLQGSSILV